MITTQAALRALFWQEHPHFKRTCVRIKKPGHYYRALDQNEYPTDVRVSWVDFVDHCARSGLIDEALASRATLK